MNRSVALLGAALLLAGATIPVAAQSADSASARRRHAQGTAAFVAARYDSALVAYTEAATLRAEIGDSIGLGASLNGIGASYYNLGQYELALDHLLRALEVRRSVHDSVGVARTLTNIGLAYQDLGQFDRAESSMREGSAMASRLPDALAQGYIDGTLGALLTRRGKQAEAEEVLTRALSAYRVVDSTRTRADSSNGWSYVSQSIALVMVRTGREEAGLALLERVLAYETGIQSLNGELRVRMALGDAYRETGRLDRAGVEYERGLALARQAGRLPLALNALRELATLEEAAGRPERALGRLRAYFALRDTLFGEAATQRLALAEARAAAERGREENARLLGRLARQRLVLALGALIVVLAAVIVAQQVRNTRRARARQEELARTNAELARANEELRTALSEVRTLKGFIPICAHCKRVRDDQGYWEGVESYISSRSEALFSHAICAECGPRLYGEYWSPDEVGEGTVSSDAAPPG